ncbi:MAG: hypothetical protein AB7O68_26165 [Pirellulales bacterium]
MFKKRLRQNKKTSCRAKVRPLRIEALEERRVLITDEAIHFLEAWQAGSRLAFQGD